MTRKQLIAVGLAALAAASATACKTPTPAPEAALKDDEPGQPAGTGGYQGPEGFLPPAENYQLWSKYCTGSQDVGDDVVPNYADADVMKAARILGIVKSASFRLYADMMKMHQTPVPTSPAGITKQAHNFLTYLCGEFRDRAPMVQAKIEWVFRIRYLAKGGTAQEVSCADRNDALMGDVAEASLPATGSFDRQGSPWAQMCIEDYKPYLRISRAVFDFREGTLRGGSENLEYEDGTSATGSLQIGERADIDRHVPGYSICETKYIMAEYVKKKRAFRTPSTQPVKQAYKAYSDGYAQFKTGCSSEDLAWYYDFRGDSNYKPNSPEGNAMIWMGKVAAAQCANRVTAKPGMAMTDADCRRYYETPFRSRYLAARAGLGAWLLHDKPLEGLFASPSNKFYTVVNHAHDNQADVFSARGPFYFRTGDAFSNGKLTQVGQPGQYMPGFEQHWGSKDFGLVKLSGLTGVKAQEWLFNRLQRAVDRHTNWYRSSYDSAPTLPLNNSARRTIDQAFSPFVASSYEMSESDNFTQCGLTIPCGNNPNPDFSEHKQWMFIFKVRKDNWYRPEDIAAGKINPDFDRIWLDETSFGDDDLANRERAWDRLGTPMEDEHAEILYLWRIPADQ